MNCGRWKTGTWERVWVCAPHSHARVQCAPYSTIAATPNWHWIYFWGWWMVNIPAIRATFSITVAQTHTHYQALLIWATRAICNIVSGCSRSSLKLRADRNYITTLCFSCACCFNCDDKPRDTMWIYLMGRFAAKLPIFSTTAHWLTADER